MNTRKGLGKGMGMGYKNIVQQDPYIHALSAKGVKSYNSLQNFKKDVKQGKLFDVVKIKGVIYTQDFYDMSGKEITYGNKKKNKGIRIETQDRYKLGFEDADVFFDDNPLIREDISYIDAKSKNPVNSKNLVNYIMEYEDGNLTSDDTLYLFSYLIKTGKAWTLQGSYGRMAKGFIDNGYIDNKGKINWYNASNFYAKGTKLGKMREEFEGLIRDDKDFQKTWAEKDGSYNESSFKEWYNEYYNSKKKRTLNAIGKVWTQVVRKILPHETRVRGKIANTLRDDEIETILATMEFFGASDQVIAQAHSDMKIPRYRMGDWLGMFIQNEGYDKVGGETATKVLAHAYIKADGDIDKMIQDLRENDYQVDTSWEKINLREV
jgi:hypothetical protein